MIRGALCVVTAVFCLVLAAQSAFGQTSLWSSFLPGTPPPTDSLLPQMELETRNLEWSFPTSLSLGQWLEGESTAGFGVARLRPDLGLSRRPQGLEVGVGTPYRLIDTDLQQTAISFDVKLAWPSRTDPASSGGAFQPYLSFGPAVFVAERNPFGNVMGTLADTAVRVGMKAQAGVTWKLDRNTALFSEYRFTHGGDSPILSSGGRLGPGNSASGYDILYGVRFSY
jgi:hypothetical protein